MLDYISILKRELVRAAGCTEPVAIAYAVAQAADLVMDHSAFVTLANIEAIDLVLSKNIIKNALGVGIPGTGQNGIGIAATLGAVLHNPECKLEVLKTFSSDQLKDAQGLLSRHVLSINKTSEQNSEVWALDELLYISATIRYAGQQASCIIAGQHTNIVYLAKNDEVLLDVRPLKRSCSCSHVPTDPSHTSSQLGACEHSVQQANEASVQGMDYRELSLKGIDAFIRSAPVDDLVFLDEAIRLNHAISEEGLRGYWGLQVGKHLLPNSKMLARGVVAGLDDVSLSQHLSAAASAASDARMAGCSLPVMSCAGSGNQGIAATMPLIRYAQLHGTEREELYRALALSILVVIHVKDFIGRLSPLCGSAIAGAAGSACGILYLKGYGVREYHHAINTVFAMLQGMICDGAKGSCALKIAAGTNAACQAVALAVSGISPTSAEGIIFDDAEDTIRHTSDLLHKGLHDADEAILDIMLSKESQALSDQDEPKTEA